MPTKTKHMTRKASMGDTAPLAKLPKVETEETSESARVILDSDKVETATKALARIPKKVQRSQVASSSSSSAVFDLDDQVNSRVISR